MAASEWEKPVADAIAAKFATVEGIRATASLGADELEGLPGVIVLAPELTLLEQTGSHETWRAVYPCYVIEQPIPDAERAMARVVLLVGKARVAWWSGIKLGLTYVTHSRIVGGSPELFSLGTEDGDLPAYNLEVEATIRETGMRTA